MAMRTEPLLAEGKYYFASIDESRFAALSPYQDRMTAVFREKEGLTVVFSEAFMNDVASLTNKPVLGPFALITLGAQTELYAIGILAKITEALVKEKIAVNAFSAYFHDHLLVPYERKDDAMRALGKLG